VFTEPLAAACEITEQLHVHPTDRVVVLGDGKLGLLVAAIEKVENFLIRLPQLYPVDPAVWC